MSEIEQVAYEWLLGHWPGWLVVLDGHRRFVGVSTGAWGHAPALGKALDELLDAPGVECFERVQRGGGLANLRFAGEPAEAAYRIHPIEYQGCLAGWVLERADGSGVSVDALRESAEVDPLTGVGNRRRLDRCWAELVHGAAARGLFIWVVMADVDDFKQVNERLGFLAADEVLKGVAGALAGAVRAGDLVIRLGGDEFLLVGMCAVREDAEVVARRVLAGVQAAGEASVSLGVVADVAGVGEEVSAWVTRASEAVRAAKGRGKGGYVLADGSSA